MMFALFLPTMSMIGLAVAAVVVAVELLHSPIVLYHVSALAVECIRAVPMKTHPCGLLFDMPSNLE